MSCGVIASKDRAVIPKARSENNERRCVNTWGESKWLGGKWLEEGR